MTFDKGQLTMMEETGVPVSFELNGVKLEVERKFEESLAAKCTTVTRRTGVPKYTFHKLFLQ